MRFADPGVNPAAGVPAANVASDEQPVAYYRSVDVRRRIEEYCGIDDLGTGQPSAWRIAGYGGIERLQQSDGSPVAFGWEELGRLLTEGADICRSLADSDGTLLQMDIDYTNADDPAEPYLEPRLAFARLEPAYRAVRNLFVSHGILPLTVMTGRGYHLSARVRRGTLFHRALLEIGRLPDPLRAKYESTADVEAAAFWGSAHEGAGRLIEHLAHEVLRLLAGRTDVPVTLADVPPPGGGAFICLDVSAYGDPLFERFARCAFSSNQKAGMKALASARPFVICLPRDGRSIAGLLRARLDPVRAARLASSTSTRIPDAPGEDLRWVESYRRSRLARFHRDFDEGRHDEPATWSATYDRLDLSRVPACVRLPLEWPNPLLLQPVFLRTVTLALWGMGWHPRSIAGLVRSKYERDYGWGDQWYRYSAAARADFYVRLFAGLLVDGLEERSEFSCESQRGRGVCANTGCGYDLEALVEGVFAGRKQES